MVGEPSPPAFLSTPPLNVSGGDELYTLLSDTLIIDISGDLFEDLETLPC